MINNYSWDMDNPMNSIYHHQRLGAKWGKMNGPPYPLSPADYSAAQKRAVANGDAKVAKDAPKTSEKKSSSSSPKTEEEKAAEREAKRKAALESGDVKQIEKYIKSSSAAELNEAMNKARTAQQIKDAIAKLDQNESSKSTTEEKPSIVDPKAEKREAARQAALNSGDLNKIKTVAGQSTYSELKEAIDKANLMSSLNASIEAAKPIEPTVQDRINKAMDNVKTATNWVTTGLEAYNTVAKIYNSVNGDRSDLKFIGQDNSKIRTEAEKKLDEFKKTQEKRRKATVEEAMRSGDASKLEKAAPLMTSDELKTAQAMVALRKTLKS